MKSKLNEIEINGMTLEEQWEKGIFKNNKTIKTNEKDNETGGATID